MLILFNKYINTIKYIFIYIIASWLTVVLPCCRWMCPVAGAGILLAGVVVLPGGRGMCPRGWWCLLASSPAYSQPDT